MNTSKDIDTKLNIIWRIIAILIICLGAISTTYKIVREYDKNYTDTIRNYNLAKKNEKEIIKLKSSIVDINILLASKFGKYWKAT